MLKRRAYDELFIDQGNKNLWTSVSGYCSWLHTAALMPRPWSTLPRTLANLYICSIPMRTEMVTFAEILARDSIRCADKKGPSVVRFNPLQGQLETWVEIQYRVLYYYLFPIYQIMLVVVWLLHIPCLVVSIPSYSTIRRKRGLWDRSGSAYTKSFILPFPLSCQPM